MGLNFAKIAAATLLLLCGRLALAQTLGDGWQFRRPLSFKQMASDAPGENLAWVEFYANGKQKPDGTDFRVTTADRSLVPFKLMQASADADFVRLAFATPGDGPYFVWWGNPQAGQPPAELDIRRGVYLELLRRPPATAPAAIAEPQRLASFLLPGLGLASNPFSDQRQVTYHYAASFKIDAAITAQMQLSTAGAATLEIDGKAITSRLGRAAQVTLAAGWHRLDIRQVNPSSPALSLSWLRPGDKAMTPFPTTLFAPAARAVAGNLQRPDGSLTPDISPDPAAEVPLAPGIFAPRYTFEAILPDAMKPAFQWSFGDGQTSTGLRKTSHIFLSPGIYPVTLKLLPPEGAAQETTLRLTIRDRLYERMPKPPVDALPTVRAVLKDYRLETLSPEDAFRGMLLFETAKDDDLQIAWGRAWLAGRESRTIPVDDVVTRETLAIAGLQFRKKQFQDAAQTFHLAAAKPIGMEARVELMRREVITLCDDVNDPAAALRQAMDWSTRILRSSQAQIRASQVALAYALIATGNGKAAKAAIDAATAPPPPAPPAPAAGPTPRGGAASPPLPPSPPAAVPDPGAAWRAKVEAALGKNDLDHAALLLDQWELADPPSLWTGASRIQRIRLLADQGRHLDAARIAMQHAQANPDGPYAAELLFRAAEQYQLGNDAERARAARDRLGQRFPDSPFARPAQP